jgi:8-oxo-dGTP pyrophosphatase MutT (NUDIX family)
VSRVGELTIPGDLGEPPNTAPGPLNSDKLLSHHTVSTARDTRFQAAVLQHGAILLLRCAFRNGPTVWILPGGGLEDDEDEATCVRREVQEETGLEVRVERLLLDVPAEPPDGTYVRWRTYLCVVIGGHALPGGGEGANAELVDLTWVPLHNEASWPPDVRADVFLYPQLQAIQNRLDELNSHVGPSGLRSS